MIISAIAAMDVNGVIGSGGKIPWHLPEDLKRFREITLGYPVIMGRKTAESLPGPLERRLNIVLTYDEAYWKKGFDTANSIEYAIKIAEEYSDGKEAFIIGGGRIFTMTPRFWDRLFLTVVDDEEVSWDGNDATLTKPEVNGDTFFPVEWALSQRWSPSFFCEFRDWSKTNTRRNWFLELNKREDAIWDEGGAYFDIHKFIKSRHTLFGGKIEFGSVKGSTFDHSEQEPYV